MINVELKFKPISEPIKFNPYYKLLMLLTIIMYCTRAPKKASLSLIHLVFWGIRNDDNYKVLLDISNQKRKTMVYWAFEPGINKILSLAYAEGYCSRKIVSGEIEVTITEEGKKVIEEIETLNLFTEQIDKIKELGIIPKNRIKEANNNWELL